MAKKPNKNNAGEISKLPNSLILKIFNHLDPIVKDVFNFANTCQYIRHVVEKFDNKKIEPSFFSRKTNYNFLDPTFVCQGQEIPKTLNTQATYQEIADSLQGETKLIEKFEKLAAQKKNRLALAKFVNGLQWTGYATLAPITIPFTVLGIVFRPALRVLSAYAALGVVIWTNQHYKMKNLNNQSLLKDEALKFYSELCFFRQKQNIPQNVSLPLDKSGKILAKCKSH